MSHIQNPNIDEIFGSADQNFEVWLTVEAMQEFNVDGCVVIEIGRCGASYMATWDNLEGRPCEVERDPAAPDAVELAKKWAIANPGDAALESVEIWKSLHGHAA